jgi:hypothetical protein
VKRSFGESKEQPSVFTLLRLIGAAVKPFEAGQFLSSEFNLQLALSAE